LTVLLDDHLLRDWMVGPGRDLRSAVRRQSLATTNLWYARLCKSAARATSAGLLGHRPEAERVALVAVLVKLPADVTVVPMRDLAWRIGVLVSEHTGLSTLGSEAVAEAEALGARVLAYAALDEVRRRTQHATTGHRGRKDDPLYRIRRRLLAGHERLSPAAFARLLVLLDAGDPDGEVGAAYLAKELLRETYLATDAFDARRRLAAFYDHCATSDMPELTRLAKTIRRWEVPILRWHRTGLTNAATEGTNLIIKNIKRLGFGFRNLRGLQAPAPSALRRSMEDSPRRINTTPSTTLRRVEPVWRCDRLAVRNGRRCATADERVLRHDPTAGSGGTGRPAWTAVERSGLQSQADSPFEAAFDRAIRHAFESLSEIDLAIEALDASEVGAVLSLPPGPFEHCGREVLELHLELRSPLVMAGDVALEAGDAPLEFTALASMCTPTDGSEVVERLLRLVESPSGAVTAVLLASERF
jgi:hypothetical protein